MQSEGSQAMPMLQFVTSLFRKFKVLNRLTEKETTDFQQNIIMTLTDKEGNVDSTALGLIEKQIGVPTYILELLGAVMDRNPYRNQLQTTMSIANISKELERKHMELIKKAQVLERRQEKLVANEQQLVNKIREKAGIIQSQVIRNLQGKECEMRKSLQGLLGQVKNKEKILLQKQQQIKNSLLALAEIEAKEKSLGDRIRLQQKKEKEFRAKDYQSVVQAKEAEIKKISAANYKLEEKLKQLTTKYRTLQMAYKKGKQDISATKSTANKPKQIEPLQLSLIHGPLEEDQEFNQICLFQPNPQPSLLSEANIQLDLSADEHPERMIAVIFADREKEDKLELLGRIPSYMLKCKGHNFHRRLTESVLSLTLTLLEESDHYSAVINVLSSPESISFLQSSYLQHETNADVAEPAILILSRLKLAQQSIQLTKSFVKAVQLRFKAEKANSFLSLNLKSLLE